ncbi:MAG: hypothetical protein IH961_03870, partial [Chloroflexi bacterium]|nr:hypothetical protein [Chloroflexota bacterium]
MTPTWPKSIPATLAIPAISVVAFALASCSSGPPSAEEIIARTREAMGQLTTYRWSATHNTVSDGRFGALTTVRTDNYSGAWRADGRTEWRWLGADGQSSESGFFRRLIQIGDQ